MFGNGLLRGALAMVLSLAACAPLVPSSPEPQAVPSPTGEWMLELTQSGGFAGVMLIVQVSSDGKLVATNERTGQKATRSLGSDTLEQLALLSSRLSMAQSEPPRSACADCFLYSLELSSGGQVTRVEADDTTLAASGAADLVQLMQRLRDQALKAAP